MKKSTPLVCAMVAGLSAHLTAQAGSFGVYDPRSLAMGGVGTSMATGRNANFYNPAMLSVKHDDNKYAITFPILLARKFDPDKLNGHIDAMAAHGGQLSSALATIKNTDSLNPPGVVYSAAAAASSALSAFNAELAKANGNKMLDGEEFVGGVVTVPEKTRGLGIHVSRRSNFAAKYVYSSGDHFAINDPANGLKTNLDLCAASLFFDCDEVRQVVSNDGDINILNSKLHVRGLLVKEVGVALARRGESTNDVDIGVVVKAQMVRTFDYAVTAHKAKVDFNTGQREVHSGNIDIGATRTYGEAYRAGLVIKDLLAQKHRTVLGNAIELKPMVRAGVSRHYGWANVGIDVDLTKNDPIGSGFGMPTRFAAVGAEFDLVGTLQLRLGYRYDLAGNYGGLPSIGIGASPYGVHVDLAVANNGSETAAAFQLGYNF